MISIIFGFAHDLENQVIPVSGYYISGVVFGCIYTGPVCRNAKRHLFLRALPLTVFLFFRALPFGIRLIPPKLANLQFIEIIRDFK